MVGYLIFLCLEIYRLKERELTHWYFRMGNCSFILKVHIYCTYVCMVTLTADTDINIKTFIYIN